MKNTYSVSLVTSVIVSVKNIQAENEIEAAKKAEESVNFHQLLNNNSPRQENVAYVSWDESPSEFATVEENKSSSSKFVNPLTEEILQFAGENEDKSVKFEKLKKFSIEIQSSTFQKTLAKKQNFFQVIFKIQNSLISGKYTYLEEDAFEENEELFDALKQLPSGSEWLGLVKKTFPIFRSEKSISDDDICSECSNCDYCPGETSTCEEDYPGQQDEDGYVVTCEKFSKTGD